ncbi:hypothetical protein Gorai_013005, partial [Gossypium raimondii]|nr:hypothetical protein [Gossypium raimondii]
EWVNANLQDCHDFSLDDGDWNYLFIFQGGAVVISLRPPTFCCSRGNCAESLWGWISGFNKYLGSSSVFDGKLWIILDGLTILINWGSDNVLIQSNSLEAVKDLQDSPLEGSNSALTRRIQQMLSLFSCWIIIHISREDNQDVDKLVKMAHERWHGVQLFEDLPFGGRV